ncbi:hypothetical protein AGDE_01825 [Angomonas deanei]|uniref:Uncharacterized protein n=1 Tax=Angomonas deanei TaxID=59799 RepID=A0A7G2CRW4_9TRYP|nr:hypothetical protein AGDE_01825 [Angomonas deanei]CAD2221907.1 hypothetical protein, conserved [Angomonas deanei]|eukprot:EPY42098.1 hypothetical protein AGDE_01825 [Angomonas deanei]
MSAVPLPPEPLTYPILFTEEENHKNVNLFNSLQWLLPLYQLAGWIDAKNHNNNENKENNENEIETCLRLLPLFEPFYVMDKKLVPRDNNNNNETVGLNYYYYVTSLEFPTPKGPKRITRDKVQGEEKGDFQRQHAHQNNHALQTVTNTTAYFSLLPSHNHFLIHYENKEKLQFFNYLQLDQLRFSFAVMCEFLLTDNNLKVFHLHNGTLTGLATRDN